jgi:hypothetical protein
MRLGLLNSLESYVPCAVARPLQIINMLCCRYIDHLDTSTIEKQVFTIPFSCRNTNLKFLS